jgi:hypothetical protein
MAKDSLTIGRAQPTQARLTARLEQLVDRLEIRDVRIARVSGEVLTDQFGETEHVRVESQTPRYLLEPDRLATRFDHTFHFCEATGEVFARIDVGLVLEFELLPSDARVDDDAIAAFIEKNAFFIAYPYIRETVQATSTRLGIGPAVLGILRRSESRPRDVTIVRGGEFQLRETTDRTEGTANQ